MRLEHIAFNVGDVKALVAWYVANLDMRIIRQFDEPPFIHFLVDSSGQSLIEVYSNPAGELPDYASFHPVTFHLAYAVEDIEAMQMRLVAAGAKSGGDIEQNVVGDKLAFLRDPWGITIQLVQRTSPMLD